MSAKLLYRSRQPLSETLVVEMAVWDVPRPVRGSAHCVKYRLALIHADLCVLRYDNEAGKGDHRHLSANDPGQPYRFVDVPSLLVDFWRDVNDWRGRHEPVDD